jgi:hypothetical protein
LVSERYLSLTSLKNPEMNDMQKLVSTPATSLPVLLAYHLHKLKVTRQIQSSLKDPTPRTSNYKASYTKYITSDPMDMYFFRSRSSKNEGMSTIMGIIVDDSAFFIAKFH